MKTKTMLVGLAVALMPLLGCMPNTKSGRGFHMPTGDAARGKAAFAALRCNGCHTVDGVALPSAERTQMAVHLGGEVSRLRTYGSLVTAIIHPAREATLDFPAGAAEPGRTTPMRDLTREMTVAQLVDIVTFLEPTYRRPIAEYMAASY